MNFVSIKIVHQTTKSNMAWVDASNRDELDYWGIDELLLEPCCALKYYPEIELCFKVRESGVSSTFQREICLVFSSKEGGDSFSCALSH